MSAALDRVRVEVGGEHCRDSCGRDGCRVDLTGAPRRRLVVDADSAFPAHGEEGKRCDFILFLSGGDGALVAAPLELKSGGVDASEAVEQLQAGATFAGGFSPRADCRPILFHGGRIHRKQRAVLMRRKVDFHGRKLTVKTARCGRPRNLAEALES